MVQTRTNGWFLGLAAALALLISTPAPAAAALDEDDRRQIQKVIESQIQAFRVDDGATAFSFASPTIQQKFGTVDNFMAMVKDGYRAVYRPREVEFLELREDQGRIQQAVRLVGPDGKTVIAVYTMKRQSDGVWKIAGVYLVQTEDESA